MALTFLTRSYSSNLADVNESPYVAFERDDTRRLACQILPTGSASGGEVLEKISEELPLRRPGDIFEGLIESSPVFVKERTVGCPQGNWT